MGVALTKQGTTRHRMNAFLEASGGLTEQQIGSVQPCSVALGGLVVSVLAIGLKIHGFRPGRGRWNFRAIKIRSRTSFGGEVKPCAPCMKGIFHRKNETVISRQVSPASLVDVSAGNCLGALVDKL
jgi:hypothetical protein